MTRVDTIQSERVYGELKKMEKSIMWIDDKTYNTNPEVMFKISVSRSTRSIYVNVYSKDFEKEYKMRISDHHSSYKVPCSANDDIDFNEFDAYINKIWSKINEFKN